MGKTMVVGTPSEGGGGGKIEANEFYHAQFMGVETLDNGSVKGQFAIMTEQDGTLVRRNFIVGTFFNKYESSELKPEIANDLFVALGIEEEIAKGKEITFPEFGGDIPEKWKTPVMIYTKADKKGNINMGMKNGKFIFNADERNDITPREQGVL
jgi:hypothetical protein